MQYVAFLRGIGPSNPNMRNEKLRGVLEELGFAHVASVISTGNLIFESDSEDVEALEARIEAAWPERLGFESTTLLRTRAEIERLIADDPFGGREDVPSSRLNVTFLKREPEAEVEVPYRGEGFEVVAIGDRFVCTAVDTTTTGTPDVMRWLEKTFTKQISTRTWKTVHRIAKRMG